MPTGFGLVYLAGSVILDQMCSGTIGCSARIEKTGV